MNVNYIIVPSDSFIVSYFQMDRRYGSGEEKEVTLPVIWFLRDIFSLRGIMGVRAEL